MDFGHCVEGEDIIIESARYRHSEIAGSGEKAGDYKKCG
jgi:hypothetical protein